MDTRKIRVLSLAVLCTVVLQVQAEEDQEEHALHHPPTAPQEAKNATHVSNMSGRLKDVEGLMARIHATTDPQQREQMLAQHLDAMREFMRAMPREAHKKMKVQREQSSAEDEHAEHNASDDNPSKGGMMEGKKMGMMKGMHQKVMQRLDVLERMLRQLIEYEAVERELETQ